MATIIVKLEDFDIDESESDWPFHDLLGTVAHRGLQTRRGLTV